MEKVLLGALMLSLAGVANATPITVSDLQDQIVDGQIFDFNLDVNNYQFGTSSLLTVTVQGDFNGGSSSGENLANISIEGVDYGSYVYNSAESYNVIDYTAGVSNYNAFQFSLDFLLDADMTTAFLLDDSLSATINFGSGVNADCGWSGTGNCITGVGQSPYAAVDFTYNQVSAVPEPASILLLGLGLAGIGFSRRKKAHK